MNKYLIGPAAKSPLDWLDDEIANLVAARERLVARQNAFGGDVYEDGNVISFVKQYRTDGKKYEYVTIKAAGGWFIQASKAAASTLTWDQLVDFMFRDNVSDPNPHIVSEWRQLRG